MGLPTRRDCRSLPDVGADGVTGLPALADGLVRGAG
jgi:hypothetical protein